MQDLRNTRLEGESGHDDKRQKAGAHSSTQAISGGSIARAHS
jgi:hypothetical protein